MSKLPIQKSLRRAKQRAREKYESIRANENRTGRQIEQLEVALAANAAKNEADLELIRRQARESDQNEQERQIKNETSMRRSTSVIAVFTAVLGVVGIVGAIISGATLYAIRAQLNVMEADQRPWISLEMQSDGALTHDAIYGWQLLIKYALKNVGKSPADDVDFLATMIPWDEPRPNNDGSPKEYGTPTSSVAATIEDMCKETDLWKRLDMGQLMFPDERREKLWKTNDAHTIVGTGFAAHFLVVGCATYKFLDDPIVHRTVRVFAVGKRDYKLIDVGGEIVPADNLIFVPFSEHGSYAN